VVRAYTRAQSQPDAARALRHRIRDNDALQCASLQEAVSDATAVLCVVPADASREMAMLCAPILRSGSYYVDFTAAAVVDKQAGAALIAQAGALYVDAAVLGTVTMSGSRVPIALSGPGAHGLKALVEPEGLVVQALDAPVGHATLLKLLRSVYMKGREALIVDMLLAARRYGLERQVAASIQGPGEQVPFTELSDRVLASLTLHAERRAEELRVSGEVLGAAGVDPALARAGAEVLQRIASLGLADAFGHERPTDVAEVLELIDERSCRLGDPKDG
jgi:3-hydroxyisobutyrate dehydrogenase-like beta-hydroxyacid dehydrogenase